MSSANISTQCRTLVYQWWEEDNESLPANHPGLDVTYDRCADYAARLVQATENKRAATYFPAERVMAWLRHPEVHSPHLDMVAISRALDFDWQVLRHLTRDESQYVVAQLASMADPFDAAPDDMYSYARQHALSWGPTLKRLSPRRLRFVSGTPSERRRLVDRVCSQRLRTTTKAAA